MKTEIKKLWIEALRSRKYKQGAGVLYREESDSYCCLGVLCTVWAKKNKKNPKTVLEKNPQIGLLPSLVKNSINWNSGHELDWKLAKMNDSGDSFSQIADYIEAEL